TTTPQVEKGFFERMGEAISPTSVSRFRQMFINKYEAIEVYSKELAKKFGNGVLLADTSAIAAALMSDRAAGVAAESFKSGIPVYNKGYTYVDNMGGKVKGLMEVLMPLAQYKDPLVYRMFQNYAAMRRGVRLNAEGKMTPFTAAELAQLPKIEKEFPEFKQVFADYQTYNEGLVRYMRDTGVISAEDAKNYMKYGDYIPFYRQLEGERTIGPNIFSAISGVKAPKKLKGGDAPLGEFLETVVRNSKAAIEAGMRNVAAGRVVTQFQALNSPSGRGNLVERTTEADRGSPDVVVVRENGKDAFYKVADPLLVQSLQALNIPQIPGLDILAKPASFLREMVTRDPAFIGASVLRESLSAWITTGQRMTPIASGVNQFIKILGNASPEVEALRKAGIGSGYEFKGDVQSTSGEFSKQLKAKAGDMTTAQKSVMPIMKMWDALDRGSTAADLSTRTAVFKRVMEETGNEAEAIFQAMEVINFSRKGSSPIVQIFSAIIPFLNARIQGLDLLYRAGFGRLASASAVTQQKAFMLRSLALLGSTAMYYALVQDDEEWQRADQETRDNYWILGGFKFPIPFELGVMFKVIPERIMAYTMGDDTGQQVIDSIQRQLTGTLAFNPIPQAVLPLVETSANYSFFLQRDIVGMGKKDLAPEYQISEGTSQVAIQLGQTLGISPMKIDYVLRGYTGAMGTYAITAMDSVIRGEDDASKATWRLDQIPVLKRFMISDLGAGTVNDYYDLREKLDEVVRTTNQLERTGNIDALQEYLADNGQVLGMKDYIRALDKDM
ncbi:MAG: LPD38 domain-containing protein, partial [Bordetella sp.]